MTSTKYPMALWSEVLPGLWQGGTDDNDVVAEALWRGYQTGDEPQRPTKSQFDSVFTFYGYANPAGWHVKEVRVPFMDGDMSDLNAERDLWLPVHEAHSDWKAGRRVLIRCQAGLNRSGLVMALVLIREGYSPQEAVDLIRATRGDDALFNQRFVNWLNNDANLSYWRQKVAA